MNTPVDELPQDSSILSDPTCSSQFTPVCGITYTLFYDKGLLTMSWSLNLDFQLVCTFVLGMAFISQDCGRSGIQNFPLQALPEGSCGEIISDIDLEPREETCKERRNILDRAYTYNVWWLCNVGTDFNGNQISDCIIGAYKKINCICGFNDCNTLEFVSKWLLFLEFRNGKA